MNPWTAWAASAVAIGIIATLTMDVWAVILRRAFSIPSLDYALVGRWLGHLVSGIVTHRHIGEAAPVAGERALGWVAHYAIGIVFAGILLAIIGDGWVAAPTLWPALLMGWITLAAPFLILQPGFGFGVAAAKTPRPNVARWRSFMAHTAFGFGLYLGAGLLP